MQPIELFSTLLKLFANCAPLRPMVRRFLIGWARINKAPGYLYQCMEEVGPLLASKSSLNGQLPNGMQVVCDLRDHVQRHIYFLGSYEVVESYLFSQMIRPGFIVLDIGANIGQYSMLASKLVGESGRVFAFEPVPANFNRFRNHISLNDLKNVVACQLAVWHESTTVNLGLHESNDIEKNNGSFAIGGSVSNVNAQSVVIDEFIDNNHIDRVDFIKMDIEGAEGYAIRGMIKTLKRDKPPILMELNRDACALMGYDPQIFWDLLVHQLGYKAWVVGNSADDWFEQTSASGCYRANLLFVFGDLCGAVKQGWNLKSCLKWARN